MRGLSIIFNKGQINAERGHWSGVLKRIISCDQYLQNNNDAVLGTSSKVYTKYNGKFFYLTEMIPKFHG
jgi:hypothetical protein